ncbi:uncharacterized protein K452DRAFT_146556 [Aplosporella prunicola CBS 121167]|uniref:Uncharacterized protein n=1 Tax=Aplosporella prunicola CBS 121167 TaxID=1176127 RepID=A0A6A6BPK2_9PEZI|nr:uncharacterized protein K452DRAFT_146556 [Aplosporella prunicola CBS 121167]KAF2144757.1 hypothetical protein K452DRAFT_146556 [Aplosporella prunicola CBS 121167]
MAVVACPFRQHRDLCSRSRSPPASVRNVSYGACLSLARMARSQISHANLASKQPSNQATKARLLVTLYERLVLLAPYCRTVVLAEGLCAALSGLIRLSGLELGVSCFVCGCRAILTLGVMNLPAGLIVFPFELALSGCCLCRCPVYTQAILASMHHASSPPQPHTSYQTYKHTHRNTCTSTHPPTYCIVPSQKHAH